MPEPQTPSPGKSPDAKSSQTKSQAASFLTAWFLQYYRFATVGACLIFVAAGYFLVISPKIAKVRSIKNVLLTQAKTREQELSVRLAYLMRLAKKREAIGSEEMDRLNNMLPEKSDTAPLFAMIEGLARDSGVEVGSIQINMPKAGGREARGGSADTPARKGLPEGVKPIEITLAVTAEDYRQLKLFLSNVEKSNRLLDAVSLNYSPTASSYTLIVRTYFQSPKKSDEELSAEAAGAPAAP